MASLHFRTATQHGNAVQAVSHPDQGVSSSIGVPGWDLCCAYGRGCAGDSEHRVTTTVELTLLT